MADHLNVYLEQYQERPADTFTALRTTAAENLQQFGLPQASTEKWKYLNPKPFLQHIYEPITAENINLPQFLVLTDAYYVILINGQIDLQRSSLPNTLLIGSLAEAITTNKKLAVVFDLCNQQSLSGFAALNTMLFNDATYLAIPDNVVLDKPLHIIQYASTEQSQQVVYSRLFIMFGEHAQAKIMEQFIGTQTYWRNHVSQMYLSAGAQVQYYKLQQESEQAQLTDYTQVWQQRDSHLVHFNIDIGGNIVRHDLIVALQEAGANTICNGVYLAKAIQQMANYTEILHESSHTTSQQHYKGLAQNSSRAIFNGRIMVIADVHHVNSQLRNDNLLLSPNAEIDTKPELEIYADDVQCSHGATVGQLDDMALFYLLSRGLDEALAKELLIYGFIRVLIEELPHVTIREYLLPQILRAFATETSLLECEL
jgi:Fe-S cluster assembly protein SufD